jgi:hypothetical protein
MPEADLERVGGNQQGAHPEAVPKHHPRDEKPAILDRLQLVLLLPLQPTFLLGQLLKVSAPVDPS